MSKLFIIAGERSGDLRGAKLCEALQEQDSSIEFAGAGGEHMREAGVDICSPLAESGVVGISEAVSEMNMFFREFRTIKRKLSSFDPDAVILIDFPDFNLRFADYVKQQDIPIIYYISPQLWAWRKGRIRKMQEYVDLMIVLFEFEKEIYEEAGVPVEYVGHPLVEELEHVHSGDKLRQEIGAGEDHFVVGMLPGSRDGEFQRHYPCFRNAVRALSEYMHVDASLVPVSPEVERKTARSFRSYCGGNEFWFDGRSKEVIDASDLLLTASGTTTLEGMLLETPMVVGYKVSYITWLIGSLLVDMDYYAMCNILADKAIVPECIQMDCTPETIAREAWKIIDEVGLDTVQQHLHETKEKLGPPGASQRAADAVNNFLV